MRPVACTVTQRSLANLRRLVQALFEGEDDVGAVAGQQRRARVRCLQNGGDLHVPLRLGEPGAKLLVQRAAARRLQQPAAPPKRPPGLP